MSAYKDREWFWPWGCLIIMSICEKVHFTNKHEMNTIEMDSADHFIGSTSNLALSFPFTSHCIDKTNKTDHKLWTISFQIYGGTKWQLQLNSFLKLATLSHRYLVSIQDTRVKSVLGTHGYRFTPWIISGNCHEIITWHSIPGMLPEVALSAYHKTDAI